MLIQDAPATVQCDADGCGFSIQTTMGNTPGFLGQKCPDCGAVLVTEEDVAIVTLVLKAFDGTDLPEIGEAGSHILKLSTAPDDAIIDVVENPEYAAPEEADQEEPC